MKYTFREPSRLGLQNSVHLFIKKLKSFFFYTNGDTDPNQNICKNEEIRKWKTMNKRNK